MNITVTMPAISRGGSPQAFSDSVDETLGKINPWAVQVNALAAEVNAKEASTVAAATAAASSATTAGSAATAASASASTATTKAGEAGTSATAAASSATAADAARVAAEAAAAAAGGGAVSSVAGKTGAVTLVKADVGLGNVDNTSDADKPVSTAQATAINARIASTEKGAANGVAPLGADSKIASTYLPSYVDDVLEAANFAALPGTGETGKIYTTLDNGKIYRWSGSAYVEISASPGSTDSVTEGSTNLYFTAQRVRDAVLTGLSTATNAVIAAGDSVLVAFGKLQKQITDLTTTVGTKQATLVSGTSIKTINSTSLLGSGDIVIAASSAGAFYKADPATVAFAKTGAGTAQIKAGTKVDVLGTLVTFASATSITMPTLTAGTDYAIYACTDGTCRADSSFSAPTGYTTANSRKIGGFHYAPGGNAAAQSGGDTTPAINAYSLWDLSFRPTCQDPRGMTLVGDSFWADIYLLGVDHLTNGTSKYNVTIADGSSPPKIPTKFGGNGSTAYSTLNWWEGAEVLNAWGKRYPKYDEFAALAYGTTEASSVGTDPASTVLNAAYTSRWGCVQSSGVMWVWGANFGGGAAAAAWVSNTGRGDTYQMENAVLFGGAWASATNSGSRASAWNYSPTFSNSSIGVRAVCDHLILG
jgi:hypothetical protein